MRKFFSVALFVVSFTTLNAQIKNDKGTFTKPGAGEWVFETMMRLDASGGALFSLNDGFLAKLASGMNYEDVFDNPDYSSKNYFPMLKLRRFKSDKVAERASLNISFSSMSDKTNVGGTTTKASGSDIGIAIGYGREKHFRGAERLSTYLGYEGTFGVNFLSYKVGSTTKNTQTGFGLGVKALTGMDYYIIPKVYLGLELGYGVSFNSYSKVKFKSGDNGNSSNNFVLTPFVSPVFRLGYRL